MLAKIKRWFELRDLTGLEARLGSDGVETVHACTLQIAGDHLSVEAERTGLKNIAHFAKHFKPVPVALCLSGKGVLSKKIQDTAATAQQALQQVLPNANAADFYLQLEADSLSLIRKNIADPVLAELSASGFRVISLNLGGQGSTNIPGKIKPELAGAYSAAFQVLLGQEQAEVSSPELEEHKQQVYAKAKLMGRGLVLGCTLLVLLLVNFFLFTHYQSAAEKLAFRKTRSGQEIKKFQQMESGIMQKTMLITTAGWAGGYPYAWLTGELMSSRPLAIGISVFSINPQKIQAIVSSREAVYETGKIRISGTCDKAATLNNWLFEIRAKDWVKDCGILSYEFNKESGKGQFTIDIAINDYEG